MAFNNIYFHLAQHRLVFDVPDLDGVDVVYCGQCYPEPTLDNKHGEADNTMWFHAIRSHAHNVLVVASDTDVWVGGMGIMELEWLGDKNVVVKCSHDVFVDINAGVKAISEHPALQKLKYPVGTVVALYTLTGNDYLSSFHYKTKAIFLTALIDNVDHICTVDEQLLSVEEGVNTVVLNQAAWHRLAATVYLPNTYLYSNSFDCIDSAYRELTTPPLSQERIRMLREAGLPDQCVCLNGSTEWVEFVGRVSWFYNLSLKKKEPEVLTLPSPSKFKSMIQKINLQV